MKWQSKNLHSCSVCAAHAEVSIHAKLFISWNDNLACQPTSRPLSIISPSRLTPASSHLQTQTSDNSMREPVSPPTPPSNMGKRVSVNLGHWSRSAGRVGPSHIYLLQCAHSDQTSRLDVYMLLKHCGVTMATYRGACKAACDFGRTLRWCNERR